MIELILAKKIASLFVIIFMGFMLVKLKFLKDKDSKVVSTLLIYLITPCVILCSFQVDYSPEIRNGLLLAVAVSVILHIILLAVTYLLSGVLHFNAIEKGSILYSNAGNLIVPLVTSLFGDEWVIYTVAFSSVQQILLWSHCKVMISGQKDISLKKIFLNINLICILIGLILFATGLRFPDIAMDAMTSVKNMVGPAAMLVTGMLLGGKNLKSVFEYKRIWLVTFFRLVFFPILSVSFIKFSGITSLVPNGKIILMITLLATITPSASTITNMAQVYDNDGAYASAINVVTTILCIITMPLIIGFYQM